MGEANFYYFTCLNLGGCQCLKLCRAMSQAATQLFQANHKLLVRTLYKRIFRLHRGLPGDFRLLGDGYCRDEFKRHKGCTKSEADVFLREWTSYAITLAKQLSKRTAFQSFGVNLKEEQLEEFKAEQVVQLYELFQESTKPISEEGSS